MTKNEIITILIVSVVIVWFSWILPEWKPTVAPKPPDAPQKTEQVIIDNYGMVVGKIVTRLVRP